MADVVTVTTTETATGTVTSVEVLTASDQGPVGAQGNIGETGPSAYAAWLALGNTGTEADFIASLKGDPGADSTVPGPPGDIGPAGLSAYEQWLLAGNVGDEAAFLASLVGAPGAPGADGADSTVPGPPGADSTVPGPPGAAGADGASAYEVWLANGGIGTEADYLASLTGPPGPPGSPGADGADGADSTVPGPPGSPGVSVTAAEIDVSGHLIITLSDASSFDAGLAVGTDGADGTNGADGADGRTVLSGAGAPGGVGADGDFYIDTTAHAIYGPKTAGAWGSSTSLVGPAGADGADGADGLGLPTPSFPTDEGKVAVARAAASGYALEAVSGGSSLEARATATATTASLANNASGDVSVTIPKGCVVLTIATDVAARVGLYRTSAHRTSDSGRFDGTPTIPPSGVSAPAAQVTTTATALTVPVDEDFSNLDAAPADAAYLRVRNLSGITQAITVSVTTRRTEA